ncbi:MAG: tetratricopeptide repeat protein [Myxococcota bacterium]
MGIGDLVRKLFSQDPKPSPWADVGDEDLDRLWRSRQTLSRKGVLQLRDAFVERERPFPFADVGSPYAPAVPDLDAVLEREDLLDVLRRHDPHVRPGGPVRVGPSGALIACGDGEVLRVHLPPWRTDSSSTPLAPHDGDRLAAEVGLDGAGEPSKAPQGDLDEGVEVGRLQVRRLQRDPDVLEVIGEEEGLRVLLGVAVPVAHLPGPPAATHVVGAFRLPTTDDDVAALQESGWDAPEVLGVDRVALLQEAAGTSGAATSLFAVDLHLPCHAHGRGVPVGAAAQPTLDAALRGAWDEVEAAMADLDDDAVREIVHHLVVDGGPSELDALLDRAEAVRGTSSRLSTWRGLTEELRGDVDAARSHYRKAADADPPSPGAVGQLAYLDAAAGDLDAARRRAEEAAEAADADAAAQANLALAAWLAGDGEGAVAVVQATQLPAGSWLGNLLDDTIHEGDPQRDGFGLLSLAGYHHGPYRAALDHLRAGGFEEGERLLRRCLELEPRHPAALGSLALHLQRVGRGDEAVALCDDALDRMPRYPHLRAIRAGLHMDAGRTEQAAVDWRDALEAAPDQIDWRLNLVLAFLRLDRPDAASAEVDALAAHGADMALVSDLRRRLKERG